MHCLYNYWFRYENGKEKLSVGSKKKCLIKEPYQESEKKCLFKEPYKESKKKIRGSEKCLIKEPYQGSKKCLIKEPYQGSKKCLVKEQRCYAKIHKTNQKTTPDIESFFRHIFKVCSITSVIYIPLALFTLFKIYGGVWFITGM